MLITRLSRLPQTCYKTPSADGCTCLQCGQICFVNRSVENAQSCTSSLTASSLSRPQSRRRAALRRRRARWSRWRRPRACALRRSPWRTAKSCGGKFKSVFFLSKLAHLSEGVGQPHVVFADGHAEPVDARHLARDHRAQRRVADLVLRQRPG